MTPTGLPPARASGFYPHGTPDGESTDVEFHCTNPDCPAQGYWTAPARAELGGTFLLDDDLSRCGYPESPS